MCLFSHILFLLFLLVPNPRRRNYFQYLHEIIVYTPFRLPNITSRQHIPNIAFTLTVMHRYVSYCRFRHSVVVKQFKCRLHVIRCAFVVHNLVAVKSIISRSAFFIMSIMSIFDYKYRYCVSLPCNAR